MASDSYQPAACRIIPHGLRDNGDSLYFRLALAPRGMPDGADLTTYNEFWWDWPARLYAAWNAGRVQLSWQAFHPPLAAPSKTLVLDSTNARVTAPSLDGNPRLDNTLSWLRKPITSASSAPDLEAVWRALTARVNTFAPLNVFPALSSTTRPRVKASSCTSNIPQAYDNILAAETLRLALIRLNAERQSQESNPKPWLSHIQGGAQQWLESTFPYLIHRHDYRTDKVLLPNLCGNEDKSCHIREQLKSALYSAKAAQDPLAAIIERDLARLCQSGRPFEDLSCSALLTTFESLRGTLACPFCDKAPGGQPDPKKPVDAGVAWARSAIYRGAAQTAATVKHHEDLHKAASLARQRWHTSPSAASVPTDGSQLDVGQVTTLANDCPLAELFGLALDITVSKSAIDIALGQGTVASLLHQPSALRCGFAAPNSGAGQPFKFDSYSPPIVCTGDAAFLPEENAPNQTRMIQGGFLRLSDDSQFSAIDFKYSTYHANYRLWYSVTSAHLNRLAHAIDKLQSMGTPLLPRERRSANELLRSTLDDTPEVPEILDGLVEIYYKDAAARLDGRLDNEAAQKNAGEDGLSVALYAKDLIRGYGLDVHVDSQWVSQTYAAEYRSVSIDGTHWTQLLDGSQELEGLIKWAPHRRVDVTGDPKNPSPPGDLHAPENILIWSGFGLRVQPPGGMRDSESRAEDQHRALRTSTGIPKRYHFSALRYSTEVLLRMPVFDLTGAKMETATYDTGVELNVPITRHRRFQAPELLIAAPRDGAESLGETLDNIVLRTGKSRNDDRSERVLVPPRVSEAVAYLEGKFDRRSGGHRLRDSGTFADVLLKKIIPPTPANNGSSNTPAALYVTYQFPVSPPGKVPGKCPMFQEPRTLPTGAYWPDPRCVHAYFVIVNRIAGSQDTRQIPVPFYSSTRWPKALRIHLIVVRGNKYAVDRAYIGERQTIKVTLPPAYQVEITLQCAPEGTTFDNHNPPVVPTAGLYVANPHASTKLTDTQAFAATSPQRKLTLVHAVDTPLRPPHVTVFNFRQIIDAYVAQIPHPGSQKAVTDTTVAFDGAVSVDYKSTGKITLLATWDETSLSAGGKQSKHFEVPLATLDTNEDTLGLDRIGSIVDALDADTTAIPDWVVQGAHLVAFNAVPPRARSVQVVTRAGVRDEFSRYFAKDALAKPVQGTGLPALWLNSRRPAPPKLKQAIHSFYRYDGRAREERKRSLSSHEIARTSAGLCIYVEEPLQSSGERGLLGVVLWQQPRSHAQQYALSRQSNDSSDRAMPMFGGMNFSANYPVHGDGTPFPAPGDVPLLTKVHCDYTRNHVTRWAGDVFEDYPKVTSAAPTLANFVLQGTAPGECVDPYTGTAKPYSVAVFDYLSVGGLEPFELPGSPNPPPIGGSPTAKESLPEYPLTILGYEPQYDPNKRLYYYEIRFQNFLPETFLKLALVYLQPNSLRFAECSEVVFTPYIKPLGDRFIVVTPNWTGSEFYIDVYGSRSVDAQDNNVEHKLIEAHGAFRIELYAKDMAGRARRATPHGSNTRVTLEIKPAAERGPACLWSGRLVINDSDLRDCRLFVKEARQYAQPGSTWPQQGIGEVVVYWEQFTIGS